MFFKKWKSKNPNKRKEWIVKSNPAKSNHKSILIDIVKNDQDSSVRSEVIIKITDQNLIASIAKNDKSSEVRKVAIGKITDQNILADIATSDEDDHVKKEALKKITNQDLIDVIGLNGNTLYIRKAAVGKITDQNILASIAKNDKSSEVRKVAIGKITDQNILASIAKNDKSSEVRKAAIGKITDQNILASIAKNDKSSEVRKAAIGKITDQNILADIATDSLDYFIRQAAYKKLGQDYSKEALCDIAKNDKSSEVRKAAIGKITDQNILADIATSDEDDQVKKEAFKKITNQDLIDVIGLNGNTLYIRKAAVGKITDQNILASIAKNDKSSEVRKVAIGKITDQNILASIAKNDKSSEVRKAAIGKITDQNILADIATDSLDYFIRQAAYKKLGQDYSKEALCDIAKNDKSSEVRKAAIGKITDQNILADIATSDEDDQVKKEAFKKITNQDLIDDIVENESKKPLLPKSKLLSIAKDLVPNTTGTGLFVGSMDDYLSRSMRQENDFARRQNAYRKIIETVESEVKLNTILKKHNVNRDSVLYLMKSLEKYIARAKYKEHENLESYNIFFTEASSVLTPITLDFLLKHHKNNNFKLGSLNTEESGKRICSALWDHFVDGKELRLEKLEEEAIQDIKKKTNLKERLLLEDFNNCDGGREICGLFNTYDSKDFEKFIEIYPLNYLDLTDSGALDDKKAKRFQRISFLSEVLASYEETQKEDPEANLPDKFQWQNVLEKLLSRIVPYYLTFKKENINSGVKIELYNLALKLISLDKEKEAISLLGLASQNSLKDANYWIIASHFNIATKSKDKIDAEKGLKVISDMQINNLIPKEYIDTVNQMQNILDKLFKTGKLETPPKLGQ